MLQFTQKFDAGQKEYNFIDVELYLKFDSSENPGIVGTWIPVLTYTKSFFETRRRC